MNPQNLKLYWKFDNPLIFDEFFSSWKGARFVIKLVSAKLIRQHIITFFFTLSYFLYNNLLNKKDLIGLVHKNHDKMANIMLHQTNIFAEVLNRQILKVLHVLQVFTKIWLKRLSNVYCFQIWTFKRFVWILPISGRLGIRQIIRTDGNRYLL